MTMIPTLTTARLTLRPHIMADFPAYADFLASDRARYMGGPIDRMLAWAWFTSDLAQWHLLGLGSLAVTDRHTGAFLGQVNVIHPPHFPEVEIGWIALPGTEGRGLMTEAARAIRDWAFGPRGLPMLVSYIDTANTRSIALAERLGARRDLLAATPHGRPMGVWRMHRGAAA